MVASRGETGAAELLICRVGGKVCGFALAHVIETLRPLRVEPLAQLPASALGLSMIRGRPTPVLDGRRLLGASSSEPARRFVTLRLGPNRKLALAVDDVLGVRRIPLATLADLPTLARNEPTSESSRLGTLDEELLVVLDHARLLSEAAWQAIELWPA
jgi:purine-binding chemotaxis protein CheW